MARIKKSTGIVADWWIPGKEAEVAPGTYSVLDNGNAGALLHRVMGEDTKFLFQSRSEYSLLHGVAFGKAVTLVDARVARARMGLGSDQAEIEVRPRLALEGLLLSEEELTLTEAKVRIQRQDDWTAPHTFHPQRDENGAFIKGVIYQEFPESTAQLPNGTVSLRDFSECRSTGSQVIAESRTGFHFHFDAPISLEDFIQEYLRGLQVLMTLATGKRCGVESLRFSNSEWVIEGAKSAAQQWVEARMWAPEIKDSKRQTDLLFPYSKMDWPTQAPRVFELSKEWGYAIEQWALLLDERFVWPVARFSTVVSAVETLDRILHPGEHFAPDEELRNRVVEALKETSLTGKDRKKVKSALDRPTEISLQERIRRLASSTPEAVGVIVDKPEWAERLARLRNIVSHGLPPTEELSSDVRSVQCASEILLHLLECTFLLHAGFDKRQVATLKAESPDTDRRKAVVRECLDLLPSQPVQAQTPTAIGSVAPDAAAS